MTIDSREFRQTLGQFATGVTIIATDDAGTTRGMTANAFSSLSLDPPLVLFCVGKTSKMGEAIRKASGFSVSILTDAQQDLSNYFAGMWKEPQPPPLTWTAWDGAPRLDGCMAALGCSIETVLEGGDHWIVCGRVQAIHQGHADAEPLLFFKGRYAALARA